MVQNSSASQWLRSAHKPVLLLFACLFPLFADSIPIPGAGRRIAEIGDDFEDPAWEYIYNDPKSCQDLDAQKRNKPLGYSANGRWAESGYRGHPDVIERITPPAGGIAGSQGALLLKTLESGCPGEYNNQREQEDFLATFPQTFTPAQRPSVVVHYYLPPYDQWRPRLHAAQLSIRTQTLSHVKGGEPDPNGWIWPGMWIVFRPASEQYPTDTAYIRMRANEEGHDQAAIGLYPGWWTFGLSFSKDGKVHYFASEGAEPLDASDHLGSFYPYGRVIDEISSLFINVITVHDGATWSTEWIVDDAFFFVDDSAAVRASEHRATIPARPRQCKFHGTAGHPSPICDLQGKEIPMGAQMAPGAYFVYGRMILFSGGKLEPRRYRN